MNYYIIEFDSLIGQLYFESKVRFRIIDDELLNQEKSPLIIQFQTDYAEKNFLEYSGNFIVNRETKNKLEESSLSGLDFKVIDKVIREFRVDDNYQPLEDTETTDDDYWLLLSPAFNSFDFNHWRTNCVVSEKALEFLYNNALFEDVIAGKTYGKEYEVLTNRFLVEGEIEDFVLNKMPNHRNYIKSMRKKIMKEYRKREGLPPLP